MECIDAIINKYIPNHDQNTRLKVKAAIERDVLGAYILGKYPQANRFKTDKLLYDFTMELKNRHLKNSEPISKIIYDTKIKNAHSSLGMHTYSSRVQGGKIKRKNEIRISHIFKDAPEALMQTVVVHELAHIKVKEHDKAFYKLCTHMLSDYHQMEFDLRLYLLNIEVEKSQLSMPQTSSLQEQL